MARSIVCAIAVVACVGAFRAPATRPCRVARGPRLARLSMSANEIGPDQFTEKAWEALQGAAQGAGARSGGGVEPEDILGAVLRQDDNGLLNRALRLCEPPADVKVLARVVEDKLRAFPKVSGATGPARFGPRAQTAVQNAMDLSKKLGDAYVSNEVLGLALHAPDLCGPLYASAGCATADALKAAVTKLRGDATVDSKTPEASMDALNTYGRDLTKAAKAGKLDPVIGRDAEIKRTIQILSRRTKNNACLVGEPGVGKTAIAEGLARRPGNPEKTRGFSDFGGLYLGRIPVDSAPS